MPLYHCSTVWLLSWMTKTKVSHTYHFGPEIKHSSKIRKKLTTIVINIAANKWLPNIGQNKLWWEVHSYKGLTSIFEEVASELLFGLAVKCLEIQLFWLKKIKTFTKNIGVPICLDIYLRLQYSKFWAILKHFFFLLRYIATNDLYLFLKKLPLSSCLA